MKTVKLGLLVVLLVAGVGLTMSTAAADQYSARRATSVKVVWRQSMRSHVYHLKRDARYSRHLRVRYAPKRDAKRVAWISDAHEKVYDRYTKKAAIYYHVRERHGHRSGWVWRGYLHEKVARPATAPTV